MASQLFLLHSVTDFAPGFFSDTVVAGGNIQLKRDNAIFPQKGCYTSSIFPANAFFRLAASWNAETPPGTGVEMQVRVQADSRWSRWFSCGVWSTEGQQGRREVDPQLSPRGGDEDEVARMEDAVLSVAVSGTVADMLQMRIWLYTFNGQASPSVRLLACSASGPLPVREDAVPFQRQLELPAYSCQTRDPALAGHCADATALTMLMNRWGRDLLPEEVARAAYSTGTGRYNNYAFLCAVAGMYGFASHMEYAGIGALRREVWEGRAVAAKVYGGAVLPPGAEEEGVPSAHSPGNAGAEGGYLVAVSGFASRNGEEVVLLNDPMMPTDTQTRREVPLEMFRSIYTGLALFLARGPRGAGRARPQRRLAGMTLRENTLCLYDGQERLNPTRLRGGQGESTLCYTLSDDVAYASSAQKRFYYPVADEEGLVYVAPADAAGRRITLYLIAPGGCTWVAEKQL